MSPWHRWQILTISPIFVDQIHGPSSDNDAHEPFFYFLPVTMRAAHAASGIISTGASGFDWWKRQISALAPPLFQSGPPDALLIDVQQFTPHPHGIRLAGNVLARRNGVEVSIAHLDAPFQRPAGFPPSSPVRLRLPKDMTLQRIVTFPAMAKLHLRTAVAFEMDRLTPFNAQDVLWSIGQSKREGKNLQLSLLIVPRSTVDALITALGRMALFPSILESDSGCLRLAQPARTPVNRLQRSLWVLCGGLAVAFLSIPIVEQQHQLNTANNQIARLMPQQQALSALRERLAVFDSSRAVDNAARKNADQLRILAQLTSALPDGTWLDQLTLAGDDITMAGQSGNAADLIAALAAAPGFSNPSFTAPVTRTADRGADLFSLQVSTKQVSRK
jgi:general secretion pathway protein L